MERKLPPLVDESWREMMEPLLDKPEMDIIRGLFSLPNLCPVNHKVFRAFSLPLDKVKVVMLGLSPYNHSVSWIEKRKGKNVRVVKKLATGIAMGVEGTNHTPPTLEILHAACDIDTGVIPDGWWLFDKSLLWWHEQGVLMLNAALTVCEKEGARNHLEYWEFFIRATIEYLSEKKNELVFVLMGADAQKFEKLIFEMKHLVLKPCHPAATARAQNNPPIKKHLDFKTYRIFSKTNQYLKDRGIEPIQWYDETKGHKGENKPGGTAGT